MTSLKGYTAGLARLLGTTPAALYERQRALVRAGLLDLNDGRGPGSGVRTTTGSVALLLIAVLATDSLAETEQRTLDITAARISGADRCPFTGMKLFQDAFVAILTSKFKSRNVIEISVSRTAARAVITYRAGRATHTVEFAGDRCNEPALRVSASMGREPLRKIADDIDAILTDKEAAEAGRP